MVLSELRKAPHLSASSISDYIQCGLSYKFSRVDKLKPEFKSDNLEFGTSIHAVLGELYQQKMIGETLGINDIHAAFENQWTKNAAENQDIKYSDGKNFEILLQEGKDLLTAYYNQRPHDDFQVIAIEEPFSIALDGCAVPIIGAMDLIEDDSSGKLIVTDFKTAGKAYSSDEVDRNFQLTLYQIAAKALGYVDHEILLRFQCLIKTKTPKYEEYYTTRSEVDEKRAIKKIIEVSKGVSKRVFIPNDAPSNWKCKGCGYKQHCEDWFMKEAA